jgi:hypothetical protein
MKSFHIATTIACLGMTALAGAWTSTAFAATAEEKAKCEQMAKQMGSGVPHDHAQDKGGAPNAMTREHMRCKEILGTAGSGDKKESSGHDHK